MSDGKTDRCWVPESDLGKVVGVRDKLLNVRYRYICKYRYHINRVLPLKTPYIKVANWHIAGQIKRIFFCGSLQIIEYFKELLGKVGYLYVF